MNSPVIFILLIVVCAVGVLGCFIMSVVFSYKPNLVYPDPIVNVDRSGNLTKFYLRCDVADNGEYRSALLKNCNSGGYFVEPDCDIPPMHSYWYATFAFGETECPSGYLEGFTQTVNLSVNLVALASSMMILGGFIFAIPFLLWYICCQ